MQDDTVSEVCPPGKNLQGFTRLYHCEGVPMERERSFDSEGEPLAVSWPHVAHFPTLTNPVHRCIPVSRMGPWPAHKSVPLKSLG